MDEIKIKLIYRREDFNEVYYTDSTKSVFSWPGTQRPIIATILIAFLSLVNYFLANKYQEVVWISLTVICMLILIISIIYLVFSIYRYYQWKSPIESYLNKLSKYKSQLLVLNENTLEIRNDDETSIEKWENIKKASILSNYISLSNSMNDGYIFPQKCMSPEEYEKLKEVINYKMKTQLKDLIEEIP
jgi:hypothetical protein